MVARVVGLASALIAVASATAAAPAPLALDPAWKAAEVLAFIGVRPGDKVADIMGGRLLPALSRAVGPSGVVYAVETAEATQVTPIALFNANLLALNTPNVVVSADPIAAPLPPGLDAVFIRQNYHDLYDEWLGHPDVDAFNRAVFAALKPGGVYVVLDHAAKPGSDLAETDTLHRIDPARVKTDLRAAGFVLDAESAILANPADDHTQGVLRPGLRDHTDQFLLRFRKPR